MARHRFGSLASAVLGLAAVTSAPAPVRATPAAELAVHLVCPQRPGPGRLVCEAELEVDVGSLAWADVLVIAAPAFARPLRSRVGPSAIVMASDQRQRLQLALAATAPGSGELRVRARAVVCADTEARSCRPAVREAVARVLVGPTTE
jgi:hypothetical protein